jgi:hypothetical protein
MRPDKLKFAFNHPIVLSFLILILVSENTYAQENDLSFAYYSAINLYNSGKIDTAYNLLTSSLKNNSLFKNTSNNTRALIYRLTALSSILLEKKDEARYYTRKMLSYKPYYKNNFRDGDLLELRRIVDEFTVLPRIAIGADYFFDYSTISLEKSLTSHTDPYIPEISNFRESGAGLSIEYTFTKRLSAGLGINLFMVSFSYKGAIIPLTQSSTYDLKFRYIETPIYLNYKLRYDKKLKPYFQLAVYPRFYPKQQETYNVPHRFKSSEYGTYYMQENQSDVYNGILAIFFQNYEYIDFLAGGGAIYNLKKSCFDFNIGYTPFQINTHPLKDVTSINDIPDTELFKSADEIIVTDIRRIFRFTLSYKYFWKYKAF